MNIDFNHPLVQKVYDILCKFETPPKGEHWEGFMATKIVAALAAMPMPEFDELKAFEAVIEKECGGGATMKWPNEKSHIYANQRIEDYRTGWLWAIKAIKDAATPQSVATRTKDQ